MVVAAAGNYAVGGAESGVGFAPANDPFVITVGAADTNGTTTPSDDFAAPWSAWGPTQDGFRKPELAAPGRVLNGPAPKDSTMYASFPSRKVADGYMWMSGTSFAAPIVSGAAATVLSRHPEWTPDQVKGALMASRERSDRATTRSERSASASWTSRRRSPPTGARTRTQGSTGSSSPTRRRA